VGGGELLGAGEEGGVVGADHGGVGEGFCGADCLVAGLEWH
jgi:hypothetical protein